MKKVCNQSKLPQASSIRYIQTWARKNCKKYTLVSQNIDQSQVKQISLIIS